MRASRGSHVELFLVSVAFLVIVTTAAIASVSVLAVTKEVLCKQRQRD
jgi:hypothetical protein